MWPFCHFEITFFVSSTFPFLEEYIARHYCSNSVFFILSVCFSYYFPFRSFCVFILKCVSCRQCIIESAGFSRMSLFIPWDSHTSMQCVFIIFNAFFPLQPLSDPLLHPVQCHVLLTKSNLCYPFTHGVGPSPGSWLIYQGDHTPNWLFLPQKPSALGGCWSALSIHVGMLTVLISCRCCEFLGQGSCRVQKTLFHAVTHAVLCPLSHNVSQQWVEGSVIQMPF